MTTMNENEPLENILQFRIISSKCPHERFLIDERFQDVECADCGFRMNPFFVMKSLLNYTRVLKKKKAEAEAAIREAEEKTKFKCSYCHKFTRLK